MCTGVISYGIYTAEKEFDDYVAASKHLVMTTRDGHFIISIIFSIQFPSHLDFLDLSIRRHEDPRKPGRIKIQWGIRSSGPC
jgi:hypothetical protein